MDKGKSLGTTLCSIGLGRTDEQIFRQSAMEELKEGKRIRFRLKPYGYEGRGITHWHLRHVRSNILFIILGETGL